MEERLFREVRPFGIEKAIPFKPRAGCLGNGSGFRNCFCSDRLKKSEPNDESEHRAN